MATERMEYRSSSELRLGRRLNTPPQFSFQNQLWLLKNSFRGVSARNFVCKLLNVGSPKMLKLSKITNLVPFSTATVVFRTPETLSAGCSETMICRARYAEDFGTTSVFEIRDLLICRLKMNIVLYREFNVENGE